MKALRNSSPTNEVLRAGSHGQRRIVLRAEDAPASREAIRSQLHHAHLPVLDEVARCSPDEDDDR